MTSSFVMPVMLSLYRLPVKHLDQRQTDIPIADNIRMENMLLRQILADNLRQAMAESTGADTQMSLAKRAGIAQSHVSKLLRCEAAATTDVLASLAHALGRQPWELLADSEQTRQSALRKMILGDRVTDERAAETLPPAPKKVSANRRKKPRS
jgi:transcriptional regulator with XRE-family HTH domain